MCRHSSLFLAFFSTHDYSWQCSRAYITAQPFVGIPPALFRSSMRYKACDLTLLLVEAFVWTSVFERDDPGSAIY